MPFPASRAERLGASDIFVAKKRFGGEKREIVVVVVRVLVGLSSKFGRGRASCSNPPGTEGIIMGRIPLEGVRDQLGLGSRSPALDRTIAHWREAITDGNI